MSRAAGRIDYMDGWRAVSILLVILSHACIKTTAFNIGNSFFGNVVGKLATTGVDIFFLISGFVICLGLIREQERRRVDLVGFYIRRFFRIIPPLAVYITCITILGLWNVIPNTLTETFRSSVFICNFGSCGWYLGHTWSLGFEEQFYIAFPILLLILTAWRGWILAVACLIPFAAIACYFVFGPPVTEYLHSVSFLALGAALAVHRESVRHHIASIGPILFPICLVAVLFSATLPHSSIATAYRIAVLPFAAAGMLVSTERCKHASRCLSLAPVVGIGRVSYSIYLWQQLAIGLTFSAPGSVVVAAVGFTLVGSFLSFQFFEGPLIRFGRSLRPSEVVLENRSVI